MDIKKLKKELEVRRKAIGRERDKLHEVVSEYEDLKGVCEDACENLDAAIDSLSELT